MALAWLMRWRNSIAAIADMAPPLAPPKIGNLGLRVISALVMLPLAIAAVWVGGIAFSVLLGVAAAAMCWELSSLCGEKWSPVTLLAMGVGAVAPILASVVGFDIAAIVVGAGTLAILIFCLVRRSANTVILLTGVPYIVLGIAAAVWLRGLPDTGLLTLLWLIGVVVATDVGAYFTGRAIGGPKLAPIISPNKTWSGLAGGAMLAGCVGLFVGVGSSEAAPGAVTAASVILAVVSQMGDLLESAVKRHFGVKDASTLIPGHGGFLDRFDGYLTVMPAAALMSVAGGGSPVIWQ
jgi:phosphatidate cytidylyltransferase